MQQGLGGGRCAVASRHEHKGGGGRRDGCGLLLQRTDDGRRVSFGDTEALGPGGHRAGRGITEGAQGRQQHGAKGVDPLIGFALAHAAQTSLDHLEAVRLQVRAQEEPPVFRRREGAVFVDGNLAGGAGFPSEAPRGHRGLERRLAGRDALLTLVEGQAGAIQQLRRARRPIGKP